MITYKSCNSIKITSNSKLMTQKIHKTQKDEKLVPPKNNIPR